MFRAQDTSSDRQFCINRRASSPRPALRETRLRRRTRAVDLCARVSDPCRLGLQAIRLAEVRIPYFEVQIADFSAVSTDGAMYQSRKGLNDDRIDQ